MNLPDLKTVLRRLCSAARRADGGESDGLLLERFLRGRDEAAFAVLVRRHGAMVWGVCTRVLADHHDAEDAFQATFLVLAGRAESVRPRDRVGAWLHGVARRVALKARSARALRRSREQAAAPRQAEQPPAVDDLRPVLDEELDRLPAAYRQAVLLCDLEGLSRREAARRLGWSEGTLSGRLARARRLLAGRLTRRGVTLAATVVAAALAVEATSAAPSALVSSTIRAAALVAAGQAGVTARVAALTEGVQRAMSQSRIKTVVAALLVLAGLSLGGLLWHAAQADPPKAEKDKPTAGRIFVGVTVGDADRPEVMTLAVDPESGASEVIVRGLSRGRVSPDGGTLAFLRDFKVWTSPTKPGSEAAQLSDLQAWSVAWSHDGKELVGSTGETMRNKGVWRLIEPSRLGFVSWRLDPKTGQRVVEEALPLPTTDVVWDCSPDGEWLATVTREWLPNRGEVFVVKRDGSERHRVSQAGGDQYRPRFSPDGKRLLYHRSEGREMALYVVGLDGKEPQKVAQGASVGACWSPDGKRLAVAFRNDREPGGRLEVTDPDGGRRREVKLGLEKLRWVDDPDWR